MTSTTVLELFSTVDKPLACKISLSSSADLSVPNSIMVLSSESCRLSSKTLAVFFDFFHLATLGGGGITWSCGLT